MTTGHRDPVYTLSPERLSAPATAALVSGIAQRSIHVASISLWEIAMLTAKNRLGLAVSAAEFIRDAVQVLRAEVVQISPEIAGLSATLGIHGDPADRIIFATALHLGLPLVTADGLLRQDRRITTIW